MAVFDIILIAIMVYAIVQGLMKGFVMSIASLLGVLVSLYVTKNYGPMLMDFVLSKIGWTAEVNTAVSYVIVFLVMTVLHSLDEKFLARAKRISLYVEFANNSDLSAFMHYLKERQIRTVDLEFSRADSVHTGAISILLTLRLQKRTSHEALLTELGTFPGVTLMEEV